MGNLILVAARDAYVDEMDYAFQQIIGGATGNITLKNLKRVSQVSALNFSEEIYLTEMERLVGTSFAN